VEYTFEVSSPAPIEKIHELVRLIERGCHTINTIKQPTPVVAHVVHNGKPLETMRD